MLHDKIDEQQTAFARAAPSTMVASHLPSLISTEAAHSYDYVQSDGKIVPPAPNTHDLSMATAKKQHPNLTDQQIQDWAKQNNYNMVP
jgi:hypothetical protein